MKITLINYRDVKTLKTEGEKIVEFKLKRKYGKNFPRKAFELNSITKNQGIWANYRLIRN